MDVKLATQTLSLNETIDIGMRRLTQYIWVMGVSIFANIALLAITLSYGPGLSTISKITLTLFVIGATSFGALGGKSALEDVRAAGDDFVEQSASTRHSRELAKKPMGLFTMLTTGLTALIGLSLLLMIWAA
jgi:hypothetical protein